MTGVLQQQQQTACVGCGDCNLPESALFGQYQCSLKRRPLRMMWGEKPWALDSTHTARKHGWTAIYKAAVNERQARRLCATRSRNPVCTRGARDYYIYGRKHEVQKRKLSSRLQFESKGLTKTEGF